MQLFVLHEEAAHAWCDERQRAVRHDADIPSLIADALESKLITGADGIDLAIDLVAEGADGFNGIRVLVGAVHEYWLASPIQRLTSHAPVSATSLHDPVGIMRTITTLANAMLKDFTERTGPW